LVARRARRCLNHVNRKSTGRVQEEYRKSTGRVQEVVVEQETVRETRNKKEMDCVTMVLVERETGLPLDLVVLINSFLYERLTDENFKQAIALWFENKEECKFRFGHISDWNTSRVTNMI
jgi:hypothetical protein